MNVRIVAVVAVASVVGAGWALSRLPDVARFPEPGKPMPDFVYRSLDGDTMRLSSQRGRVVLVNVWATWCAPCREEMPSIQRLYDVYRDSGFTVLAVSIDVDTGAVRPFVEELSLTFPILLDPAVSITERFGTVGVPESFLADRDGNLVLRRVGADDWFSAVNRRLIAALLRSPLETNQNDDESSRGTG